MPLACAPAPRRSCRQAGLLRFLNCKVDFDSEHVMYAITRDVAFTCALHCIALHCIALHCIALYCIALHCIALQCAADERDRDQLSESEIKDTPLEHLLKI